MLLVSGAGHAQPKVAEGGVQPKSIGWRFAPFPLLNYSSDKGVGYGGVLVAIDQGENPDRTEPFESSTGLQFYQSTTGYAFHKAFFDFRDIGGSGSHLTSFLGYERWPDTPYFGSGGDTLRRREGSPDEEHGMEGFWFVPRVEVPLIRRSLLWVGGGTFRGVRIWNLESSLGQLPRGANGGWLSELETGIQWTTLERAVSPTSGMEVECTVRGGGRWIGSRWSTIGANCFGRGAHAVDRSGDWVFAWLGMSDYVHGAPFFHEQWFGGKLRETYGGPNLLRGYPVGRKRGMVKSTASMELRWAVLGWQMFQRGFDLLLAGFTDGGVVWTPHSERTDAEKSKVQPDWSGGFGPRLIYEKVFLLRFDVAFALERYKDDVTQSESIGLGQGFYVGVGHPF